MSQSSYKLIHTAEEVDKKLNALDELFDAVHSAEDDLSKQIDVERSRVDNIIALENDGTTGYNELADLRIGYNDHEYDSAGTAVRSQIRNLERSFETVSTAVVECPNILDTSNFKVGYYKTADADDPTIVYNNNDDYQTVINPIEVKNGQSKVYLTAQLPSTVTALVDDSYNVDQGDEGIVNYIASKYTPKVFIRFIQKTDNEEEYKNLSSSSSYYRELLGTPVCYDIPSGCTHIIIYSSWAYEERGNHTLDNVCLSYSEVGFTKYAAPTYTETKVLKKSALPSDIAELPNTALRIGVDITDLSERLTATNALIEDCTGNIRKVEEQLSDIVETTETTTNNLINATSTKQQDGTEVLVGQEFGYASTEDTANIDGDGNAGKLFVIPKYNGTESYVAISTPISVEERSDDNIVYLRAKENTLFTNVRDAGTSVYAYNNGEEVEYTAKIRLRFLKMYSNNDSGVYYEVLPTVTDSEKHLLECYYGKCVVKSITVQVPTDCTHIHLEVTYGTAENGSHRVSDVCLSYIALDEFEAGGTAQTVTKTLRNELLPSNIADLPTRIDDVDTVLSSKTEEIGSLQESLNSITKQVENVKSIQDSFDAYIIPGGNNILNPDCEPGSFIIDSESYITYGSNNYHTRVKAACPIEQGTKTIWVRTKLPTEAEGFDGDLDADGVLDNTFDQNYKTTLLIYFLEKLDENDEIKYKALVVDSTAIEPRVYSRYFKNFISKPVEVNVPLGCTHIYVQVGGSRTGHDPSKVCISYNKLESFEDFVPKAHNTVKESALPDSLLAVTKSAIKNTDKLNSMANDIFPIDYDYFDPSKIIRGYEINATSKRISAQAGSIISDYIPVTPRTAVFISNLPTYTKFYGNQSRLIGLFDKDKNFISVKSGMTSTSDKFYLLIPDNICYIVLCLAQRLKVNDADEDIAAEAQTLYNTFDCNHVTVTLDGYRQQKQDFISAEDLARTPKKIAPTRDKKVIIFGDSITETAGMEADGTGYISTKRFNWPTFAQLMLQTNNITNYAKAGATCRDTGYQWVGFDADGNQICRPKPTKDKEDGDWPWSKWDWTYTWYATEAELNEVIAEKLDEAELIKDNNNKVTGVNLHWFVKDKNSEEVYDDTNCVVSTWKWLHQVEDDYQWVGFVGDTMTCIPRPADSNSNVRAEWQTDGTNKYWKWYKNHSWHDSDALKAYLEKLDSDKPPVTYDTDYAHVYTWEWNEDKCKWIGLKYNGEIAYEPSEADGAWSTDAFIDNAQQNALKNAIEKAMYNKDEQGQLIPKFEGAIAYGDYTWAWEPDSYTVAEEIVKKWVGTPKAGGAKLIPNPGRVKDDWSDPEWPEEYWSWCYDSLDNAHLKPSGLEYRTKLVWEAIAAAGLKLTTDYVVDRWVWAAPDNSTYRLNLSEQVDLATKPQWGLFYREFDNKGNPKTPKSRGIELFWPDKAILNGEAWDWCYKWHSKEELDDILETNNVTIREAIAENIDVVTAAIKDATGYDLNIRDADDTLNNYLAKCEWRWGPRFDQENAPDIIVLTIGSNDSTSIIDAEKEISLGTVQADTSIGSFKDAMDIEAFSDFNYNNRQKMFNAYRYAMWSLRHAFPRAKCYAGLPVQRQAMEIPSKTIEAITHMAKRYGFKIVDAYTDSRFLRENEITLKVKDGTAEKLLKQGFYLPDGLHTSTVEVGVSVEGVKKQAEAYANAILSDYLAEDYMSSMVTIANS